MKLLDMFDTSSTEVAKFGNQLSVLSIPPQIAKDYKSLALISNAGQLALLDLKDRATLIVTTDWLTWRKCLDQKGHCLHFESMLGKWPEEMSQPDDHHRRSCEWMYVDGQDISVFCGVSLGKQFNKDIALLCRAHIRLWHALDRICRKYSPSSIVYYDIRAEYGRLNQEAKINLVEDVAKQHGLKVINKSHKVDKTLQIHPDADFDGRVAQGTGAIHWLRRGYEIIVETLFAISFRFRRPFPRLFILLNWQALSGLLEHFDGYEITPVLLSRQWPKSLHFIADCWQRGIYLTKLPNSKLDVQDLFQVDQICEHIKKAISEPKNCMERARANFVLNYIIGSGRILECAREVKNYDLMFKAHGFTQLLVGDAENGTCRMLSELAHREGIVTNELLNGLFMTHQYFDVRSGDDIHPRYIDRLLTWGKQNELWLNAKGTNIKCIRTGYPALKKFERKHSECSGRGENALVLPMSMEGVVSLHANIFTTLVSTVCVVKELGYSSIRVKVHLGHPIKKYFDEINEYFDLGCNIIQQGHIDEHLEWADIVIGPINSGAFVETMMYGKPYYPMRAKPTSLKDELFSGVEAIENAAELKSAIARKIYPDPDAVLENYCSVSSIPNASNRVWEVLSGRSVQN